MTLLSHSQTSYLEQFAFKPQCHNFNKVYIYETLTGEVSIGSSAHEAHGEHCRNLKLRKPYSMGDATGIEMI